jgi:hypothetical protein
MISRLCTGDFVFAAAGRGDAAAETAIQADPVPDSDRRWRHARGLPSCCGALGTAPEVSFHLPCCDCRCSGLQYLSALINDHDTQTKLLVSQLNSVAARMQRRHIGRRE